MLIPYYLIVTIFGYPYLFRTNCFWETQISHIDNRYIPLPQWQINDISSLMIVIIYTVKVEQHFCFYNRGCDPVYYI